MAPKKFKWTRNCPGDYNDAESSNSENDDDHDYRHPDPTALQLSQETDRKVAKVILTSLASWSLLDNEPFVRLCSELLGGTYCVPSRSHIQEKVVTPMYEQTKALIKNELQKYRNIGLTTDAWCSTTQQIYITLTAHIIDEYCNLKKYVLDTTEITQRHTSANLMEHIDQILTEYEINTKTENEHNIIVNFNATNPDDVHEEYQEEEHEVNYLKNVDKDKVLESESQTQDLIFERDNGSDITKAFSRIGGYQQFGCAGRHLNLVAQAGFKEVQPAANLVKKCKQFVEHITSTGSTTYLLIDHQNEFEIPLLKVLQETNAIWWSIFLLMDMILSNFNEITKTLLPTKTSALTLTASDKTNMSAILSLLRPFKECGKLLSSENDVTISLIVPHFNTLRQHLSPNASDSKLIEEMKSKMLLKLNDRYSKQEIQSLTVATLLDVRHKNEVKHGFDQLHSLLLNFVPTQNEIPATEGQELENLSAIMRNKDKSIFSYKDDEVSEDYEDLILCELNSYKNVKFSASEKENINVLSWWKNNKKEYPHIFELVRSNLHIPATSVPSQRIISLAGYIVRDRRSRILSQNVNKAIFLTENAKHIPRVTTV